MDCSRNPSHLPKTSPGPPFRFCRIPFSVLRSAISQATAYCYKNRESIFCAGIKGIPQGESGEIVICGVFSYACPVAVPGEYPSAANRLRLSPTAATRSGPYSATGGAPIAPPLAVGRVRETYGTFPGGALHTFSPRRKYAVPPPTGGNPHFSRRLPRQCAHWLAMTRLYKNHPGGNSGVVSPF